VNTQRNRGFVSAREQATLGAAHVAIAGVGGDGGQVAETLARLGVSSFALADPEDFEAENLNRQNTAFVDTIGRNKALVLSETVARVNPRARVDTYPEGVTSQNVARFVRSADLVIDEIERHIGPEDVACVIAEPVQGEGGFVVPAPEFLPRLAEYCRDRGILFVADEVQTGFGRTGRWFASEHFDLVPDIVVTAKALGGGLPIGGITARADVMDAVHVGGLGGTFGGNPVAAAAALQVLSAIEGEGLLERAERVGAALTAGLRDLQDRHEVVGDVRGLGAMVAMELVEERGSKHPAKEAAARTIEECYRQGLIALKAGTYDNVVRLLPPLTIADDLVEEGLGLLDKALSAATQ
jgi:4-aminobutyrate aminotransferase-like enzyme